MNDLVFLTPNTQEPFTTSDVIAEKTGNSYRSVQRMIEKQKSHSINLDRCDLKSHLLDMTEAQI